MKIRANLISPLFYYPLTLISYVYSSNTNDIITLLLVTQYFDTIRDVGSAGHCKTTFVPTTKSTGDEIRNAMMQAKAGD